MAYLLFGKSCSTKTVDSVKTNKTHSRILEGTRRHPLVWTSVRCTQPVGKRTSWDPNPPNRSGVKLVINESNKRDEGRK